MTNDELTTWIEYHGNRFSDWFSWFKNQPASGDGVTQPGLLAGWWDLLRYVDIINAMAATDAMNAGRLAEPRTPSGHVRTIASYAKAEARRVTTRYVGNEPTVRCKQCEDIGVVVVWHPKAMRAAQDDRFGERGTMYRIAVACTCGLGDFKAERQQMLRFNPACMMPEDPGDSREITAQKLKAFADKARGDKTTFRGTPEEYQKIVAGA